MTLAENEVWTVWSMNVPLGSFVSNFATTVVSLIAEQFATGIKNIVTSAQATIKSDKAALVLAYNNLSSSLENYYATFNAGLTRLVTLRSLEQLMYNEAVKADRITFTFVYITGLKSNGRVLLLFNG